MKFNFAMLLGLVLSLVVLNTALQIEYWNDQAGGALPNKEPGKLRGTSTSEWLWRNEQARQTGDESLLTGRPLTPSEKHSLDMRRSSPRNKLVDWTRGMGLLQYLLAPLAFGLSLVLALVCVEKRARVLFRFLTITNALAIFLMFFRGYYNG
jgi:hypothetical protein